MCRFGHQGLDRRRMGLTRVPSGMRGDAMQWHIAFGIVQCMEGHRPALAGVRVRAMQALPRLLGPSPSSALAGSKLLDAQGATWLQGSSLWVTLGPEGAVLLQGEPTRPTATSIRYIPTSTWPGGSLGPAGLLTAPASTWSIVGAAAAACM